MSKFRHTSSLHPFLAVIIYRQIVLTKNCAPFAIAVSKKIRR
jgi:hypothetical protein